MGVTCETVSSIRLREFCGFFPLSLPKKCAFKGFGSFFPREISYM